VEGGRHSSRRLTPFLPSPSCLVHPKLDFAQAVNGEHDEIAGTHALGGDDAAGDHHVAAQETAAVRREVATGLPLMLARPCSPQGAFVQKCPAAGD